MRLSNIHLTLANVRKAQNISQQAIAESLNIEQATVSMYENGKRGIPLNLLEAWLKLLCIDITITPKGFAPVKPISEVKNSLIQFEYLKKRRNYYIAELRAMMAEKIMQNPVFQKTQVDTGENHFWPYSFPESVYVGLVETRHDHPDQKYLAVEYTKDEINTYRFLAPHESGDGEGDHAQLNINRIYFSEDDFLTLSSQWGQSRLDMRKRTILRKNSLCPGGIEVINSEGFSLQSLIHMQENFIHLMSVILEVENISLYKEMTANLEIITNELVEISMTNRLENGAINPEFNLWADFDYMAVAVPLWSAKRNWTWSEEGVEWGEDLQEIHN